MSAATALGADPVGAVLFDLDDTLFAQSAWLDGAWTAVAERAAANGVDPDDLEPALRSIAAQGSARGGIIDRALERIGRTDVDVGPLVAAFSAHAPRRLDLAPGVSAALQTLGSRVPLGLVTDGNPTIQRAKVTALGVADHFAVMVFSDELGREHRKPDPLPFLTALRALDVEPALAVYVGDRPEKDVAGALGIGMRCIRVCTGEYATAPDHPEATAVVDDAVAAIDMVLDLVPLPAMGAPPTG